MKQLFDANKTIETDNLIIRFISSNDYKDLYTNILNDKDVLKYFLCPYFDDISKGKEYIEKLVKNSLKNEIYTFSIVQKSNMEVIGLILQCSIPDVYHNSCELGYCLGKKFWNKGYATQALKAVISYMFDIGIYKVYASHILENVASSKVMKKANMIYEGRKHKELYYHGQYYDCDEYYILNPIL